MHQKDLMVIDAIKDIVSESYKINLFSSVNDVKEAVDVTAYIMKKHTRLKNYTIAKTLNRSTTSDFATRAVHNIEAKKKDANFNARLVELEVRLLTY